MVIKSLKSIQLRILKHTSQKVINFRNLLSCDPIGDIILHCTRSVNCLLGIQLFHKYHPYKYSQRIMGRTNIDLSFFPDSIEVLSLQGSTFWCSEINQSRHHWRGDARFSWSEDNDLPVRCRHCLFLIYS